MIDSQWTHPRLNSLRPSDACIHANKPNIIGSDNGLAPTNRQAIFLSNGGILLIGPLGTNFSEIIIEIYTFSFKKMHLECRLQNGGHFASHQCANHALISVNLICYKRPLVGYIYAVYPIKYIHHVVLKDHSLHALSQWETTLHCNVVSHWLGAYTK